jgi:hypothetical protein
MLTIRVQKQKGLDDRFFFKKLEGPKPQQVKIIASRKRAQSTKFTNKLGNKKRNKENEIRSKNYNRFQGFKLKIKTCLHSSYAKARELLSEKDSWRCLVLANFL